MDEEFGVGQNVPELGLQVAVDVLGGLHVGTPSGAAGAA
jgi:hypothetical protein